MDEDQIPLAELSLSQLRTLEKAVPREIERKEREQRRLAFEAVEQRAQEVGLSRADLRARFSGNGVHGKSPKPERLYRHPETHQEWAGRGRRPQWVKEFEAQGGDLATIEMRAESGNADPA